MREIPVHELHEGASVISETHDYPRIVESCELLPWEAPGIFADEDPRLYGITFDDGSYLELSGGEYLTIN